MPSLLKVFLSIPLDKLRWTGSTIFAEFSCNVSVTTQFTALTISSNEAEFTLKKKQEFKGNTDNSIIDCKCFVKQLELEQKHENIL